MLYRSCGRIGWYELDTIVYFGDTYLIGCCPSRMICRQIGNLEEEPWLEAAATKLPQLVLAPSRSTYRLSNLPDDRALCQPYSGEQND